MRNQGNLQPTSRVVAILLACAWLLSIEIKAFTFSAAVVSISDPQINALATYTVSLMRSYDDSLNPTNWNTTNVPSTATSTITFPPEFNTNQLSAYSCDSVLVNSNPIIGYTCTLSSNTIIVNNLFSGGELVSEVDITLSNIINPSSALTTSPFIGTVDSDTSSNSAAAEISFTPKSLASLTINFQGGVVNRTSDMILNLVITDAIPSNGVITIQFPAVLIWARELSTNHLIPFNGTLSCYGITPEINNNTITCEGLYSTKLVTVSTFLSATLLANKVVSIGVKGLFAPPTTQPIDTLIVSTRDNNLNIINTLPSTISGLVAQTLSPYTMQSSLTTPMGVNNFAGGLTFSFTLTDTISFRDYFLITFPTGTTITFAQSTSTIKLLSSTYTSSNLSLVLIQNTTNANFGGGTSVVITFIKYKAPPSTKPSGSIKFSILNNGYAKMAGSATITAIANNYTLTATASSKVVNVFTSYSFTFTMVDALSNSGYFVLVIDPQLCSTNPQKTTITTNLSITISGTSINSSPSTQISTTTINGSPTYQLLLSNLNISSANIPTQSITITVNNLLNPSSVSTLTAFTLSTYYSNSADLVANAIYSGSITMQTGSINLNSITSTATTTYTFTTIAVNFKNTNPIPSNGYFILTIPSDITLLTASQAKVYVSSSLISSTFTNFISNNTIVIQISTAIAASSSIAINANNIMTQNTTKPTASFVVSSYDSSFNGIDQSTNSIGLTVSSGNNFNSLTLTRGSSANSFATNYTFVFEQIQSYTSVSVVSFKFNSLLSLSSLSRVFQVTDSGTTPCLFTKVNNTYLQVTLSQSLTSTHTIIIQKVINPPSEAPLTSSILVTTLTSNYSYTYSSMYTDDIINTDPSSLTINSYSFSSYVYASPTDLTLSATTLANWPAITFQLVINIPSAFDISSAACSSSISNLACSFFAPTNTLTISMTNSSPLPLNIALDVNSLIAPPYGSSSQTFTFSTFDSSNYLIQTDNSTVVFVNNCSLSCRTCSANDTSACLTCYTSPTLNLTLLHGQSCISTCPSSTYQNNRTCIDCSSLCLTCNADSSNCSTCSNSTYQLYYFNLTTSTGNCLNTCNKGTYQLNQTCFDCSSICTSCNSSSFCYQCQAGYLFFNGSCLLSCPNNTLTNSSNSSCTLCSSPCSSCINTTSTCLTCVPGTIFYNSTCSSSCPLPNLYITASQVCEACNEICLTCSVASTNCTSCNLISNSSHYLNGTCISKCPDLYYANSTSSVCELCSSLNIGCANCSSSTTCFSCDSTYFYFPLNQSCLNSTPTGYFSSNGTLYTCNSTCNSCSNAYSNCTSCSGNLSLYQNQCITACPISITVSFNNTCNYCSYPCSTCLNSTSNCLSCALNSSLFYDASTFSCVSSSSCSNSTFSDNSTYICSPCNSSCVLCSGTSTNCSKCSSTYFLISSTNTCSMICPNGTVNISLSSGGICQACAYPCLTCSGTISFCTSCSQVNASLYLSNNGSCVSSSSCQSGTYANSTNFICQTCLYPCSTCLSATSCQSCQGNYSLVASNNTCTTSCPIGSAPSTINGSSICTACNYPCSTCSFNINNCTSCSSNSSLYFQGNQCVNASSCLAGTYANLTNNVCQTCLITCLTCNSLLNCSICSANYYLDLTTNTCVASSQCQNTTVSGYNSTSGRNECLSCASPCQTCSFNIASCTSCSQSNSSAFLLNNSCVNSSSCPLGTFPDLITLTCYACVSPCAICSNYSICISCVPFYFLNGTSCLSLCPDGTYVLNSSGIISCIGCNILCATCNSGSTNCTSCPNNTFLSNNSCLNSSSCPSGTFANTNNNTCSSCQSPCITCSGPSFCQSCIGNNSIFLGNGSCLSSCPDGTISMNVSGVYTCLACSSNCLTCISNINICTSCSNTSQYLNNGSCLDSSLCPNGTFPNSANHTCQTCASPCMFCSSNSICQTCIQNFYLLNSSCSSVCQNGTVALNTSLGGLCTACQQPCLTCVNSPTICTSCIQTNVSQYYYNYSCYNSSNCPQQTYQNNLTLMCSSCVSPCLKCFSSVLCSSCVTGYYYNQNYSCISNCPNGTLAQNSTSGGICNACSFPCIQCTGALTYCTICSQANSTLFQLNGSCVASTSCSNGTYPNGTTFKCQSCSSACSTCLSSMACVTCNSGFYLIGTSCLSTCPNGTVAQNASLGGICSLCQYPCILCDVSVTNCLACSQINSTLYLSNGNCVSSSSCMNGTYPNSTTLQCQNCSTTCTSCASLSTCLTCSLGYYYNSNQCTSGCPNGTLPQNSTSGGICQPCVYPCGQCISSLTNCLSCSQVNSTLFLMNGSCVANNSCQIGTYPNTTTMKCEICVSACSSCLSYSNCTTCNSGFYYFSQNCVSVCPNGTVGENVNQSCLNCLSPCKYCSINQTFCSSCLSPFFYYSVNSTCLSSCPDLYYGDGSLLQCKECMSPCSTCSSSAICLSCVSGFYFINGSCLSNCPSGYYNNNTHLVCSPCMNNCSTCSSSTFCNSCSPPYLFFNNICGTSCPLSASFNLSNTCQNCTQAITGCISCNSTSLNNPSCSVCQSSLTLSQGICIPASSGVDGTLSSSLKTSSIFPLPFTITGSIIFIACFMSKLQNKNSYVVGTAYSLFGFIQSACLIYTIIIYHIYLSNNSSALNYEIYLQGALIVIASLNLFGLFVQTYQLYKDQKFAKWTRSTCNYCCYVIVTILSCLFNYKFKMLIFTKLFSFYCLRAQLESVQKFRLFNVMSFLGVGHEGLVLYISAIIMVSLPPKQQTFLSFLDLLIINFLNIILALAVSSKEDTFFQQQEDDGIKINKVFNAYDSYDVNLVQGDDQKKAKFKPKGLQSRDMMMDDDDEFTLSISDRDSSNINQETHAKIIPDSSINRNKSAILESESSHDHQQTGNSLKRPKNHHQPSLNLNSNNFSAVYEGDLSRQKRKQFQQQHRISRQIEEKSKHSDSGKKINEIDEDKVENKQENIFDVGAEIDEQAQNDNMMMIQNEENMERDANDAQQVKNINAQQEIFNEFQQGQIFNQPKNIQEQNILEQQPNQNPIQHNLQNDECNKINLNPSPSQANMIPPVAFQRQIKVYKGKQGSQNEPDDIEQIDLTISKKQRELIELRKSIRKKQRERERSQERKSRKNRSSSKDKKSRDAMSELGLIPPKSKENVLNRGISENAGGGGRLQIIQKPMQSSKLEVDQRLLAPVTTSPQKTTKSQKNASNMNIKQQISQSKLQNISKVKQQLNKQEDLQNSVIIDETKDVRQENQKELKQDNLHELKQEPLQQINYTKSELMNKENKTLPIPQNINNFFPSNPPQNQKEESNEQNISNANLSKADNLKQALPNQNIKVTFQKFDKQLDNKYEISPRGQLSYQVQHLDYQFIDPENDKIKKEQNIFEYKKQEHSYIEEEPEQQRHKLIGFISRPHQKIEDDEFNNFANAQDKGLQFNVTPDTENNPLENKLKKVNKQSLYSGNNSFNTNEDALDQMIDKTSRNQINKNRSHLIRKTDKFEEQINADRKSAKNQQIRAIPTQQSRLYQDLNETSTLREASEKEFTERKMLMNRPPMQHQRPATSEKNRMYIAGLKQMQGQQHVNTQRTSMDNSSLKHQIPAKTSYNMDFRGYKSKELQKQGDSKFEMYPSSFSSNQIQLGSEQLSKQPNKPLISRTARIRQLQGEEAKEQSNLLNDSFARKSMKSYKSRSIDRDQYEQQQNLSNSRKKSINREENDNGGNGDLDEYYKRSKDSPSNLSRKSRSRSKSRQANRSSDKRITELEKIYLQRLQFKK